MIDAILSMQVQIAPTIAIQTAIHLQLPDTEDEVDTAAIARQLDVLDRVDDAVRIWAQARNEAEELRGAG